jgi:hypothetical protein
VKDERREALARFASKRRRGVEPAAKLRRIDSEQPHATDGRDVDRIAIDYSPNQQRLGPRCRYAGAAGCSRDTGKDHHHAQKFHRNLL